MGTVRAFAPRIMKGEEMSSENGTCVSQITESPLAPVYPRGLPTEKPAETPVPLPKKPEVVIPLNIIFSVLSLILAIIALGLNLVFDPLGRGISSYDFSTPKAALESGVKIVNNQDIRALIQLGEVMEGKGRKEKLKSIEIHRESEWRGKVILFISYLNNGIKTYEIQGFEKDARTGFWQFARVSRWDRGMKDDNPRLVDQIESWETKGQLN